MTYFEVLAVFILPLLTALLIWVPRDVWLFLLRRGPQPNTFAYQIVLLHVIIALLYTTPWDNYLVATGVWWYNPQLVTGLKLGWVPIEEYTFFVLQTLLTGFWTIWLLRLLPVRPLQENIKQRRWITMGLGAAWVAVVGLWFSGWQPGVYMALILGWAIPPVMLQVSFGADILVAHWRALLPAVGFPTLYLWWVDSQAIGSGTWTIDPLQTTGITLGVLPLEEMVFFAATNVILVFGITLMLAPESHNRAQQLQESLEARRAGG